LSVGAFVGVFLFVALLGAGIPGPGDASLIAAGSLAGEGKLSIWIVLEVAFLAWMVGSLVGYVVGMHGGRGMLEHPGRFDKSRHKLLAKGDRGFAKHAFIASCTLPAFVSGIFKVRRPIFALGAVVAGLFWIGMYVGVAYFFGEELAHAIGTAGTKAILIAVVLVAIGLGIRAGVARWRASRSAAGSPEPVA
jgi:membrane-associated protein